MNAKIVRRKSNKRAGRPFRAYDDVSPARNPLIKSSIARQALIDAGVRTANFDKSCYGDYAFMTNRGPNGLRSKRQAELMSVS